MMNEQKMLKGLFGQHQFLLVIVVSKVPQESVLGYYLPAMYLNDLYERAMCTPA